MTITEIITPNTPLVKNFKQLPNPKMSPKIMTAAIKPRNIQSAIIILYTSVTLFLHIDYTTPRGEM